MTGPLTGLKILDLTTVLMGPYTTQILGDMGADVVKIESPEGDSVRGIGPFRNPGMGSIFLQANRGKRSIVLDLKQKQGREALLKLIETADVLVYNLRPQVMERLRLGYADVAASNPKIIYAGLFGYGQDGPYAARPAYDDLMQGGTGIPSLAQRAGTPAPRYAPLAIADRVVGIWAVGAITAALWHRERYGEGQRIDIPMFETMAQLVLGDHMGGGLFEPALGDMGYGRLLSHDRRPYPTKDGYVCALVYSDKQWRRFFTAIGEPEIFTGDPRFATITSRTRHIDEIYAMVTTYMTQRTTAEWVELLSAIDIPVEPLRTIEQLVEDPHLQAKGFFQMQQHPTEGPLRMPGVPTMFSKSPADIGGPAPRLGEHSRDILRAAGYATEAIDALVAAGITSEQPRMAAEEIEP
jgi:crotonobetainyl-CoA:carnitine CoA-transferase CaiB-like acyl-CoA transferase